jgi:hypothetical protein
VNKEEAVEKLSEWEMINQKLKTELKDVAQQLIVKSNELVSCKMELQRHRQEIDVSTIIVMQREIEIILFVCISFNTCRDLIKTFVI